MKNGKLKKLITLATVGANVICTCSMRKLKLR